MNGVKTFVGGLALFGGMAIAMSVYLGNALVAGALGAAGMLVLVLVTRLRIASDAPADPLLQRVFLILGLGLLAGAGYCLFRLTAETQPVTISLLGHASGALAVAAIQAFFLVRKFSI